MNKILVGNSFPMSLIQREVNCKPVKLQSFRELIAESEIASFWGHANTVAAASEFLGRNLRPRFERPVIDLSVNKLPVLDGCEFSEVYVISPEYIKRFRPDIGKELEYTDIKSWQIVKLTWK